MTDGGEASRAGVPGAASALEVIDLGRMSYSAALALQEQRLVRRIAGEVGDAILLVEHDPVVTRGRRSPEGDTADVPFPVVTIGRGGEATYHGPGQLVAYPILALPEGRRDLHRYLRDLEGAVIGAIGALGVVGRREAGKTGVWVGNRKICSIGVAVRRWVTWHGLALNVTTDLEAFRSFSPCGLSPEVMTNLAVALGRDAAPPAEPGAEPGAGPEAGPGAWPEAGPGAWPDALMQRAKDALAEALASRFAGPRSR